MGIILIDAVSMTKEKVNMCDRSEGEDESDLLAWRWQWNKDTLFQTRWEAGANTEDARWLLWSCRDTHTTAIHINAFARACKCTHHIVYTCTQIFKAVVEYPTHVLLKTFLGALPQYCMGFGSLTWL